MIIITNNLLKILSYSIANGKKYQKNDFNLDSNHKICYLLVILFYAIFPIQSVVALLIG